MKYLFLALSITSLLSAFGQIRVVGYFPSYRWNKLNEIDYSHLSHVCASFANPDEEGNLQFEKDLHQFVQVVHSKGTKAVVSFCGGGDYSWGEKYKVYQNLLATPESRTDFVQKIMMFAREYKLDGIDNDMEGKALELPTYNTFSQELADSLHADGLEYSAALGVGGQWGVGLLNDSTLQKLDFIMTMSYGGVGHWNWSQKPDEGTFAKYQKDVNHIIDRGYDAQKVIGGVPFYYTEFPKTQKENYWKYNGVNCDIYSNSEYKKQDPLHSDTIISLEGNPIYINSFETYQKKLDVALQNQSGIMIWELGQDCFNEGPSILKMMGKHLDEKNAKININGLENLVSITKEKKGIKVSCPFNVTSIEIINSKGVSLSNSKKKTIKIDPSTLSKGKYTFIIQLSDIKSMVKEVVFE